MRRPLLLQAALVFVAALALSQACAPLGFASEPSCCGPISSHGRRLEAVLDGMSSASSGTSAGIEWPGDYPGWAEKLFENLDQSGIPGPSRSLAGWGAM